MRTIIFLLSLIPGLVMANNATIMNDTTTFHVSLPVNFWSFQTNDIGFSNSVNAVVAATGNPATVVNAYSNNIASSNYISQTVLNSSNFVNQTVLNSSNYISQTTLNSSNFTSQTMIANSNFVTQSQINMSNILNLIAGGTPSLTTNASTLVSSAVLSGRDSDWTLILTTSAATQMPLSNYCTISNATAVSINTPIPVWGSYGTNNPTGINGTTGKFVLVGVSSNVVQIWSGTGTPAANTVYGISAHVGRF